MHEPREVRTSELQRRYKYKKSSDGDMSKNFDVQTSSSQVPSRNANRSSIWESTADVKPVAVDCSTTEDELEHLHR